MNFNGYGKAVDTTKQAYRDGAEYYRGLGYGAVVGGTEVLTEKLVGGAFSKIHGAGLLDGILPSSGLAKQGIGRYAANAVGEGFEEVAAELLSPASKAIYKGRDALSEYGEADYWKGVGKAGITGMGVSAVYGGAFDIARGGVKNGDIGAALEEIGAIKERSSRQKLDNRFTDERAERADSETLGNLRLIETTLKKSSEAKRAELIERNGLSGMFELDGSLNAELAAALSAKSQFNRNAISENMRGREKVIEEDLAKTNADLGLEGDAALTVFDGTLTAEEQSKYGKVQKVVEAFNKRSGADTALILLNPNKNINGNITPDSGRIYLSADNLTDGTWAGTIVHEFTHFAEGTAEHDALVDLLLSDEALTKQAWTRFSNKDYGFDMEAIADIHNRVKASGEPAFDVPLDEKGEMRYNKKDNGPGFDADEIFTATSAFTKQVYKEDRGDFSRWLANKTEGMLLGETREIHIYCYKAVYAFYATGYMKGFILSSQKIDNIAARRDLRKGYKNGTYKVGESIDTYAGKNRSNRGGSGSDFSVLENGGTTIQDAGFPSQQSESEQSGDFAPIRRDLSWQEIEVILKELKEKYDASRKEIDSTGNFSLKAGTKVDADEAIAYETFVSELGAHLNEELLGNEAFIDKIIRENGTLGEKILGKIIAFKEALGRIGDPEAQEQYKRLVQAEKLYLGAIEAAGKKYMNGKIVSAEDEEEKENTAEGGGKYSLCSFDDGKRFVKVDIDQELFDGLTTKEKTDLATKILKERFQGKVVGIENRAFVNGVTVDEYTHPSKHIDISAYEAKMQASTELDNLMDAGFNFRNEPDGRDGHTHPKAIGGFDYFDVIFQVGDEYYQGVINIENNKRGKRLKDITKIESITENMTSQYGKNPSYAFLRDASTISISQNPEKSTPKAKFSLKDSANADIEAQAEVGADASDENNKVTLSKGQLAALRANYHGDKVFTKKNVSEALKVVDALQALPAKVRNDFADHLWRGYNERLNQQGFDLYTEIMWHKLHAEVLQENGFEMTEEEIAQMDDQIVAALYAIVDSGKPSIKAKLESDTSVEGYRKQAQYWRDEHRNVMQYHKQLNRLKYELEKLANAKKGLYVNSANYRGDSFKVAINELARMNWRGGLVRAEKIREHFAAIDDWYSKSNPLYADDGSGHSLFRENISQALHELGNRKNGSLSIEELFAAETVVKYFQHEIEAHNAIWKDGKRVDAAPYSNRYIKGIGEAKQAVLKCGVWQSLTRNKFARLVADPAMLMRQADGYMEGGFFTEQYEELRRGVIDAGVKERELAREFEQFWEKNKAYGKRYNSDTVTFDGKEMPLQEAISLYMTMKREHAFAGIAGAGFEIDGKSARENISDGFADAVEEISKQLYDELPPEKLLALSDKARSEIERKAVAKAVKERRDVLEAQFTDDDKALISIMERGYEACRELKVAVDNIIQGFSNVTNGYYYPIVRAGLAEHVDAYTGFEGDRVSNLSMNKETTKNAHKLFIEPAHVVYMRHLKATSMYHGLGVFTDNFNRLYNLDISKAQMTEQAKAAWAYEQEETNSDIISLVEKVKKKMHKDDDPAELGSVSRETAKKIKEITGKDFMGYRLVIEARQVEHILKDHGENGQTDHSMASDDDIAKMLFAIKNPDSVVDGGTTKAYFYMENGKNRRAKTVLYERSIGEKSYYVVQTAVDTNKKKLYIVSAFIGQSEYKKGAPQLINAQGLDVTSENDVTETPRNASADNGSQVASPKESISQNDVGVNSTGETFYRGGPKTVRDALGRSNEYTKEMVKYFKELKQDVEGISKKRSQEKAYNDAVAYIRSVYATYQLGANPKVWATQFSSFFAATNIVDVDSIVKGFGVSSEDVDKYCRLAWLRNDEGSAALAQAVSEKTNAVQRATLPPLQPGRWRSSVSRSAWAR